MKKALSRWQADGLLFLVALIWGGAFLFQKQGIAITGVATFVAARFFISAVLVSPWAWRDWKRVPSPSKRLHLHLAFLCFVFVVGVLLQHLGLLSTNLTNAGFITALYVIFVAFLARFLFKQPVSARIWLAALVSLIGVALLSGGLSFTTFSRGDLLILGCAVAFAFQVAWVGRIVASWQAPYLVSWLQYAITVVVALALAFVFESPEWRTLWQARVAIFYAGAISGGIAYTLQVVAQQYTPPADSAILMSLESVFAALAGLFWMNEALTAARALGCVLILGAILLVEFAPRAKRK